MFEHSTKTKKKNNEQNTNFPNKSENTLKEYQIQQKKLLRRKELYLLLAEII